MQRKNEITVILGKKGHGKTSMTVALTDPLKRLIIFDYNQEYQKGLIVTSPHQLIHFAKLNRNGFFRLIYRPAPWLEVEKHFEYFSEIAFALTDFTVVVEEVDLVSRAGSMPRGLKQLINYGRHRAINLMALSRRANMVPRDLTANADVIISFNQHEPRDIKYISDYAGEMAGECVRNLVRTDQGSEFVEIREGKISREGRINFVDKKITWI